jgi:hypothetical protein
MMANSSWKQTGMRALFAWFFTSLAFGCADTTESRSSDTGVSHEVLTFPLTITLSTPNPVAPTTPVLGASNSVSLGARADVVTGMTVAMGSGGLSTQPDALLNETWSRGTAALRDRVRVRGTLHARTRTLGSGTAVTTWDSAPAFDPVATLSWRVNYPDGPANNAVVNAGQSVALAPGKHGTVTANSQGTLTFSTGTYYLTSLNLQAGSTVKLDQGRGPVIVYVTDVIALRSPFVPPTGTTPNVLVAYLGTNNVIVETLFDGAIVAPSASLTLRSLTGIHTGYFYAKNTILDAGARVRYRAPLALVGAAAPAGARCVELTAGQVPPKDLYKYCPGCEIPTDSDRDGFEDCVDDCDFDENKTKPGLCGCGTPEVHSDSDGVPDCLDECDLDPNNTSAGQCGCLSSDPDVQPPEPAGTRCTDSRCPQTGVLTCNGAGVCGSPSGCNPGGCKFAQYDRSSYWFCPGPATRNAAAQACRARGMALARVERFSENDFLRSLLTAPLWIGANSISSGGVFRWSTAQNDNGPQFWAGAAAGSQQNGLFSYWASGTPTTQRCVVARPGDGRWLDVDCGQALGFVCEFETPQTTSLPPGRIAEPAGDPGPTDDPMGDDCVPTEESFLPDLEPGTILRDEVIEHFQNEQAAAEAGNYLGSAQDPPDESSGGCTPPPRSSAIGEFENGGGCRFDVVAEPPDFSCFTDDDCTPLGANLVCRQVKLPTPCEPSETNLCKAASHCGVLTCPEDDPSVNACDQIDVCDPDSVLDVEDLSVLTPETFDPGSMFEAGLPNVAPSPTYEDEPEPTRRGKDHKWCFMEAQADIPTATAPVEDDVGRANTSKLSFSFDPQLVFKADVNPLSMGETKLDIQARAALTTRVKLDGFIGATFEKEMLSAVADIRAERCTLRNDDTEFRVFGADFLDLTGVPRFDSSEPGAPLHNLTQRCNATLGKFIDVSNRAKKAFRDTQQLLEQYNDAKAVFSNLRNLCDNVVGIVGAAGTNVPFFPGGLDCPAGEPAEITINRFLDYYQAPGFGQVSQLRDAVGELGKVTKELFDGFKLQKTFGPKPKGESRTIARAQFNIGPVPAQLEIAAFYSYGVSGYFEVGASPPFNPFQEPPAEPERNNILKVKAGVMPYANAGLSAFVGVGRRLGPFNASLGIEGRVQLANVKAPIFAGAGLAAEVLRDSRNFAGDIGPLVKSVGLPTHLGTPKSWKFFVWYEYGASLQATDILSGEVNGALKIKFAFFSRTWRKRIVKFNGLSPITIQLVTGKTGTDPTVAVDDDALDYKTRAGEPATENTTIVEGTTAMGMSEAQVPLLVLDHVEVPGEGEEPTAPLVDFNADTVEGMFYDDLCCAKVGEEVLIETDQCLTGGGATRGGPVPCCPGSRCAIIIDVGTRCVVDATCQPNGGFCNTTADCCDETAECGADHKCAPGGNECVPEGGGCGATNATCCGTAACSPPGGPSGVCYTCPPTGTVCDEDIDCCGGPGGGPRICQFFEDLGHSVCNDPG